MAFLEVRNITKSYGGIENRVQVLKGISTDIQKGQTCVILGPSGSGKSTFLNTIGGLDSVDKGAITVDGLDITKLNPKKAQPLPERLSRIHLSVLQSRPESDCAGKHPRLRVSGKESAENGRTALCTRTGRTSA